MLVVGGLEMLTEAGAERSVVDGAADLEQAVGTAQARIYAAHRPQCQGYRTACRVKDDRQHGIATLFGQVTVRLPRFRCAGCKTFATGMEWPSHIHSTPELDWLRAQFLRPADLSDRDRPARSDIPARRGPAFGDIAPSHLQARREVVEADDSPATRSGRGQPISWSIGG